VLLAGVGVGVRARVRVSVENCSKKVDNKTQIIERDRDFYSEATQLSNILVTADA
jgi:hypothetical protein